MFFQSVIWPVPSKSAVSGTGKIFDQSKSPSYCDPRQINIHTFLAIMSQRSAQEPQLQLGDSWVTETDGSFEVGENTSTSDSDTKGAPQNTLHRRETPRRITRSTAKKIEPELVMPAIDDDDGKGKSGEVDRRKAEGSRIMPAIDDDGGKGRSGHGGRRRAEGSRRVPLRPATEDTFPRRRSARLANGNEKVHSQPVNRQDQTSKQDLQQTRKEIVQESFSTQVLMESLESLGLWMFNTLKMVVKLLKYPASICLAVLIAAMIISYFIAFLSNLMSKAISAPFSSIPFSSLPSICRLPIVSVLCQLPTNFRETNSPVEFDEMMKVQAKFEEVLESSADSVALPLDMKRGEASIRDLRQLVRYSSLRAKCVGMFNLSDHLSMLYLLSISVMFVSAEEHVPLFRNTIHKLK